MKILFLSTVLLVLLATGCNFNEQTARAIMENPKMQQDIFDVIIADPLLNARLLDQMLENKRCRNMMLSHVKMTRMMCTPERLDSMANVDAELNEVMLHFVHCRIDQDSSWCRKLSKIIQEKDNTRTGVKKPPQ